MGYRLAAFDLDGTMLDSALQVRDETIQAIGRLRERGVGAMIVTGRHHLAAYPYWHALGLELPAICCNGAYIYDFAQRRTLAGDPIERGAARQVLHLARRHGIHVMVYVHDYMACETPDAHLARLMRWSATLPTPLQARVEQLESLEQLVDSSDTIWKFTCACDNAAAMRAFVADVEQELALACVWSNDTRLDVAQSGCSKGGRLAQWVAAAGIRLAEVIAFGDHDNDIEMLRLAGIGVAMGNSHGSVQACADWVTGSNDSDGIAAALERFVLTPEQHLAKMSG